MSKKVASVLRIQTDREILLWLKEIPQKLKPMEIATLLLQSKRRRFIIWTEERGIRLLK